MVTAPISVEVVTSATETDNGVTSILPLSQVGPIMGVGANAYGPLPTSPVQAVPGGLGQGVLINGPGDVLEFGANPLPGGASVSGAPWTTLEVSINGGPLHTLTGDAIIDSGGNYGSIPQNLIGGAVGSDVPAGDTITVYTGNGTPLYTETVSTAAGAGPSVTSSEAAGGDFNAGNFPFTEMPIYLSYSPSGIGTMYFDT